MPRRIIFYPYKMGSKSCRDLVATLRSKTNAKIFRVFPDRSYRPRPSDTIVNWGNSQVSRFQNNTSEDQWINRMGHVSMAANKLLTLRILQEAGLSHIPFVQSAAEVPEEWAQIVERHKLTGHSGEGIRIADRGSLTPAPLYTKLLTPCHEYRVHVFNGRVIDYTKKIKRVEGEIIHRADGDYVKNKVNGWEYIRDVAPRDSVTELAISAVEALGLQFGAVDIIRHKRKNYVLEVGTAPGLSPIGLEAYADAILETIQ